MIVSEKETGEPGMEIYAAGSVQLSRSMCPCRHMEIGPSYEDWRLTFHVTLFVRDMGWSCWLVTDAVRCGEVPP